jgi:ketosteroid isomerase-like protein
MDDVVATADGDVMVVRYLLVISETIDGEPVTRQAPRLTVFRQQDGRWLVAAHANFATPE